MNPIPRIRRPRKRRISSRHQAVAILSILLLVFLSICTTITAESDAEILQNNIPNDDDDDDITPTSSESPSSEEVLIANGPAPLTVEQTSNVEKGKKIASPTPKAKAQEANQSSQPTSNNDYNNNNNNRRIIPSFSTLFTPQLEEYTLSKFDPYSFSGAPLGGWGRATRSRLASLPVRLVVDYGGGLLVGEQEENSGGESGGSGKEGVRSGEEVFEEVCRDGGNNNEEGLCVLSKEELQKVDLIQEFIKDGEVTEEMFNNLWMDVVKVDNEATVIGLTGFLQIYDKLNARHTKNGGQVEVADKPKTVSAGAHFTFHDGMGRQFVCRTYEEGELEVESYMNSMFTPAVLLGQSNVDETTMGSGKGKKDKEDDLKTPMKDITIEMDTFILDGVVDETITITPNVQTLMEEIGMVLAEQFDGEDIVIEAVVADDGADITDIVKAAMQGAGINKDGGKKVATPPSTPAKSHLSPHDIFKALKKLKGYCSQLHLGWWSYEWCHEYQVRQFHVDVSPDPTAEDGRKYEIVDQKTIGHYEGKTTIVNPRGIYNGKVMAGETINVVYDHNGEMRPADTVAHGPKEDEQFSKPFYDREKDMKTVMSNRMKNELQKYKTEQHKRLGHNGGIVQQQFTHGDMCDEVGVLRQVTVEYRCCTEEEIFHWLHSKGQQNQMKKDEVPLAVLVAVQEFETCDYRAKVCTPVLCPESLTQEGMASSPVTPVKPAPQSDSNSVKQGTPEGVGEALEAVYSSLGLGEEERVIHLKRVVATEEAAHSMNELIRAAQNGEDFSKSDAFRKVMDAMGLTQKKNGDSEVVVRQESLKGKSIREVLQHTLSGRPCLMKNLGWWTYEFCHGEKILQYHSHNFIDPVSGKQKVRMESSHLLGKYTDTLSYPNEEEHLHVVNVTGISADMDIGRRNKRGVLNIGNGGGNQNEKGPGGNGAVFVQEYLHGDLCDQEDVAESVIKGGNIVHGSVERSSTVRFSCGKSLELVDIKEDSTCHYIIDVAIPALCNHPLFIAPITKTQVVKCLPV